MSYKEVVIKSGSLDDVIFLNRNKAYGAYFLRKEYPSHLKKSMLIFFSFLISLIIVYQFYDNHTTVQIPPTIIEETVFDEELFHMDKKNIDEPPSTPQNEDIKTIEHTKPIIVQDGSDDKELETIDDILKEKDAVISTETNLDGKVKQMPDPPTVISDKGTSPSEVNSQKVHDFVERMPEFLGGEDRMLAYLANMIKYPDYLKNSGVEGILLIGFVVNEDGSISDVKVLQSVSPPLDKDAVRVIKNMPTWIPGMQNGENVKVSFQVPIRFEIGDE